MRVLFDNLRTAFHDPTSRSYRRIELTIWFLIMFSVFLTLLELFRPGLTSPKGSWGGTLEQIESVVLIIFVLEIFIRVATWAPPDVDVFHLTPAERTRAEVEGRFWYILHPMQVIDILACLPAVDPSLRGLRALRLLRLLRGFRVFRFSSPFANIWTALLDNSQVYLFAFAFLFFETFVGGTVIYQIERDAGSGISTIMDGMWWALVTLTTVGYGDLTPATSVGRAWAAVLMVLGMFTLALFAGIVGSTLLSTVLTIRKEQYLMFAKHIVICGYDSGSYLLLDALAEELADGETEVVILARGERPADVHTDFRWIEGDPTKEAEFEKVRLTAAQTVMIVGERANETPQAADARTILTVFTVRRYLAGHANTAKRKHKLHVVAEVLDSENIDHAKVAGADEVIASAKVSASLLAHTVVQPGTAAIMSRVVAKGSLSCFLGDATPYIGEPFGTLLPKLKAATGVLLIGVRDEQGVEHLNPPDDLCMSEEHDLVYLAPDAVLPAPVGLR